MKKQRPTKRWLFRLCECSFHKYYFLCTPLKLHQLNERNATQHFVVYRNNSLLKCFFSLLFSRSQLLLLLYSFSFYFCLTSIFVHHCRHRLAAVCYNKLVECRVKLFQYLHENSIQRIVLALILFNSFVSIICDCSCHRVCSTNQIEMFCGLVLRSLNTSNQCKTFCRVIVWCSKANQLKTKYILRRLRFPICVIISIFGLFSSNGLVSLSLSRIDRIFVVRAAIAAIKCEFLELVFFNFNLIIYHWI